MTGLLGALGGLAPRRALLWQNWGALPRSASSEGLGTGYFPDREVAGLLTHCACQRHYSVILSMEGEGKQGTVKIGGEIRSPSASGHQIKVAGIFCASLPHMEKKEAKPFTYYPFQSVV